MLHKVTLDYIALRYVTLRYITLHYVALRCIFYSIQTFARANLKNYHVGAHDEQK